MVTTIPHGARSNDPTRPSAVDTRPAAFAPDATSLDVLELDGRPLLSEPNARKLVKTWSPEWERALSMRPESEERRLKSEAVDIVRELQQVANRRPGTSDCPVLRAFHAKGTYATTRARFHVAPNLPDELRIGPFVPGAEYRVIARFSNAPSKVEHDDVPASRGLAFRLVGPEGQIQDFNFGSTETLPTKSAEEVLALLSGTVAGVEGGLMGSLKTIHTSAEKLGLVPAIKALLQVKSGMDQDRSHTATTFFTRTPFKLGALAVKFRLLPEDVDDGALRGAGGDDALTIDFVLRRREAPIRYRLQMQGFIDAERTPMDDISRPWNSEWITVGELLFPRQSEGGEALAHEVAAEISQTLAFTPFHQWDGDGGDVLKPLGEINMLREKAYEASAEGSGRAGPSTLRCPLGFG